MVASALALLFVACLVLGVAYRRVWRRLGSLEKTLTIDPKTLIGSPFGLERELGHMLEAAQPASFAKIVVADPTRAKEAVVRLRAVCQHGVDLLFCTDLSRGALSLLTYGRLSPRDVAAYFHAELRSCGLESKIGWAYTESFDPKVRVKLRDVADAALRALEAIGTGVEVRLVDFEEWPAPNPEQEIMAQLRRQREALGLTRKELAPVLGISATDLRDLEIGRAASAKLATRIGVVLATIQCAVVRAANIALATESASGSDELVSPPDEGTRVKRTIALPAALIAEPKCAPPPASVHNPEAEVGEVAKQAAGADYATE